MGMRIKMGSEQVFGDGKGPEYHLRYPCGNEPNAYASTTRHGWFDRTAPYGYGIPSGDIHLFKGKILFGRHDVAWNLLICNFTRNAYEWRKVYSHVRAMRRYARGIPNGRWDIPPDEQ